MLVKPKERLFTPSTFKKLMRTRGFLLPLELDFLRHLSWKEQNFQGNVREEGIEGGRGV